MGACKNKRRKRHVTCAGQKIGAEYGAENRPVVQLFDNK
jgi:hypothetical protein